MTWRKYRKRQNKAENISGGLYQHGWTNLDFQHLVSGTVSHLWLWHTGTPGWHKGPGCLAVSRVWSSKQSEQHPHSQPMGSWQSQMDPEHPGDKNKYRLAQLSIFSSLYCETLKEFVFTDRLPALSDIITLFGEK